MAITKKQPAPVTEPATPGIEALPQPPSPAEEISELERQLAEAKRVHEIEIAREQRLATRYKEDAETAAEELAAMLESPLLRILNNGGNLLEIEGRLSALCEKCAHADAAVKGAMTLKIEVSSGRGGDGSVEFSITDAVKQPIEDTGACILWLGKDGKLSESNAKQRDLIDVPAGPRRPNPTDEERLDAAL